MVSNTSPILAKTPQFLKSSQNFDPSSLIFKTCLRFSELLKLNSDMKKVCT